MVAEADSRQDGSIDYKCPNRIIDVSLVTKGADDISLNNAEHNIQSRCLSVQWLLLIERTYFTFHIY